MTATGTNTALQFGFRDDVTWLGLGDIKLVAAQPGTASIGFSGTDLLLDGVNGISGRTYQTLKSPNVLRSRQQWTPITTNSLSANENFTVTVTNALNATVSQGFYRMMLSP